MGLDFTYSEGQTPIDEDEALGLRISGVSTQGDLNEHEQQNIQEAVVWTLNSRIESTELLTETFVKELHRRMFGNVWKWAGTFRQTNKNIGVSWEEIPIALRQLLLDAEYWRENSSFSGDEMAIRFKHRLVSIHCFPNGNGRHSRLMADVLIDKLFNKEPFGWHRKSLVKADESRKEYITALKEADQGKMERLIGFARG